MSNETTNMTPLHWAVFNEDVAVVKELLKADADPYIFSVTNVLPIDIAGLSDNNKLVEIFLDYSKWQKLFPDKVPGGMYHLPSASPPPCPGKVIS